MTLKLKHLKIYLDTGLRCDVNSKMFPDPELIGLKGLFAYMNYFGTQISFEISKIKPFLLPLSALTEQLPDSSIPIDKIGIYSPTGNGLAYLIEQIRTGMVEQIVFEMLLKWHFDVYGLIDQGLAIDKRTIKQL